MKAAVRYLTWSNVYLALRVPLIALDCLGNLILLQSWRNTMSAEAWWHRDHKYWWWCHQFIDGMPWFGKDHCQQQAELEEKYGSVWAAVVAGFKSKEQ